MKERDLRLWGKLGDRKGREGMAGNWWMGWRARGLAGAEENEGQSGYGQGRSWLLGLGLRNL